MSVRKLIDGKTATSAHTVVEEAMKQKEANR